MFTVKDLIEELQKMPQDAQVALYNIDEGAFFLPVERGNYKEKGIANLYCTKEDLDGDYAETDITFPFVGIS